MEQDFGSDYITITDEDGIEYELEVLSTLEYGGYLYYALIPASAGGEEAEELEVSILKSVTEDGEDMLVTIDDDAELEAVYEQMMEQLYTDEEDFDGFDREDEE